MKPQLLVCDDDPDVSALVSTVAAEAGFDTVLTANFGEFMSAYSPQASVIMLDLQLPGVDGIEIVRFLARAACRADIIMTSSSDPRVLGAATRLVSAQGLSLLGSLVKPFGPDALRALLAGKARLPDRPSTTDTGSMPALGMTDMSGDEFIVRFQPKIEIATLECRGVEALVRWQHPKLGLIGPESFIPLAERTGHIRKVTNVVVARALDHAAEWLEAGLDISVAINVSSRHLEHLDIPDRLAALVAARGLSPDRLLLEITETWMSQDAVAALDTLTRFRLKGFGLAIDDFGTGYSTLKQLSVIPFSELKLDKSFIHMAPVDAEARAILKSSVALGHELGMKVVAEGVETREEWDLVRTVGCDAAQGFLIAEAMPGEAVAEWVDRWRQQPDDALR